MATKVITEHATGDLVLSSDGTDGGVSASMRLHAVDGAHVDAQPVNIAAAVTTAAAASGLTAAQVRAVLRQFYVAARGQARVAGGWT